MKIIQYISCLYFAVLIFSCSGNLEVSDEADIVDYTGTIIVISDIYDNANYLIQSDMAYQGNIDIFYPSNLPESYKVNGLKVIFRGRLIDCPANAQCLAQEIKLTAIKVINDN